MSPVLKHLWTLASLVPRECGCPKKYGIRGCMPAGVKRTVGSYSGIRGELGIKLCSFSVKKSKNNFFSFFESMTIDRILGKTA